VFISFVSCCLLQVYNRWIVLFMLFVVLLVSLLCRLVVMLAICLLYRTTVLESVGICWFV